MNTTHKKNPLEIVESIQLDDVIIQNAIQDIECSPKTFTRIPSVAHLPEVARNLTQLVPTITECRIPIFAPLLKVSETSDIYADFKKNKGIREVQTSWGKCFVRGRVILTQLHRDLLDSILFCAEKVSYSKMDGSIQVYFYGRKVLNYYNGGSQNSNTTWLVSMLEQIRDTIIKYQSCNSTSRRKLSFDFNILRRIVYSEKNEMFYIEFDPSYVAFYQTELGVCYKSVLPNVLECDDGIVKSAIRFFVSHRQITITLDKLLSSIGVLVDKDTQAKKYYRIRKVFEEHAELFAKIGCVFDAKKLLFSHKKTKGVFNVKPVLEGLERQKAIGALSKKFTRSWDKIDFVERDKKSKELTLFDFQPSSAELAIQPTP